jgi:hypothetical protein
MMKKRVVLIPEKISISLDSKINTIHYFPLGECLSDNILEHKEEKFHLDLSIVSNSSDVFKIKNPVHSTKDYEITEKLFYFRKKHYFLDLRMLIENANSDSIKIFINKQYWRLIKYRIENINPVGIQLTDLLILKAIKNDDLIIHGASLFNRKANRAFLIMAPPAAGKTYTLSTLLQNESYQYLGEDVSYYDSQNNKLYCVPFSSSWGHHKNYLPFFYKYTNVINIFGKNKIKEKSDLKRIYLLEHGPEDRIKKIPVDTWLLDKILNLQRNTFSYSSNPLLRTFDYFLGGLGIEYLYRKEISLFEKMLKDKEIYLVSAANYDNFHKIIHENED